MLNVRIVLVFFCAFVFQVLGDLCMRKELPSTKRGSANSSRLKEELYHNCHYGCCHKTGNPCCEAPFYTGAAFIVTVIAALAIPVIMGFIVCLVLRSRRLQRRDRRRRRERRRQRELERIFYLSGGFAPDVLEGSLPPQVPAGSPISPPEYSEIENESSTTSPQPPPPPSSTPRPPPPPYTRTSTGSTETDSDDDDNKINNNNRGFSV